MDQDSSGGWLCFSRKLDLIIQFQATGAAGETTFYLTLNTDEIVTEPHKTIYYWKGGYPEDKKDKGYRDYGSVDPEDFNELLRDELFSITISARKAQR